MDYRQAENEAGVGEGQDDPSGFFSSVEQTIADIEVIREQLATLEAMWVDC